MIKVIGVRFRTAGKIYYFDPVDFDIKKGDHVIVETARGIEFGTVVGGVKQVCDDEIVQPLKPVIRVANERDVLQEEENKRREKEAYQICLAKIREHELDMKLIDAEYTFDNNKVLFYFTADGRIDFRELVKDLAAVFKTRIELRQIGVRDETKIVGGIGMCGRPLCCHTHLSDFIPVSIKMAKEQNLSLNPTKISGVCGRLMCCLKHEEETYEELNRNLPNIGDMVTCPDGVQGEVTHVNVLRQLVKVVVEKGDAKEICEFHTDDIKFVRRGNRRMKEEVSAEELRALELLEKQDKMDNAENDAKPAKTSRRERSEQREERSEERRGRRENRQEEHSEERRERRESQQEERGEERRERRESRQEERSEERRGRRENRQEERGEERRGRRENRQEERGEERRGRRENRQEERGEERRERRESRQEERGEERRERKESRQDNRRENRKNGENTIEKRLDKKQPSEESVNRQEENQNREGRKKNFYRNRNRRSQTDGAKEQ